MELPKIPTKKMLWTMRSILERFADSGSMRGTEILECFSDSLDVQTSHVLRARTLLVVAGFVSRKVITFSPVVEYHYYITPLGCGYLGELVEGKTDIQTWITYCNG